MERAMNDINGVVCQGLAVNPDISGIGVRLSFYIQNLFLVLLVTRSWEDAPGALWTFVITSFGLTLAAILQARDQQLTFFQALQVLNLVWMANFGSYLTLASYSRHRANHHHERMEQQSTKKSKKAESPETDDSVKFATALQIFFSMGFTLYTWANPSTFNESECLPSVKYVIFAPVLALQSGRIASFTVMGIIVIAYCVITICELLSYLKNKKIRRKSEKQDHELPTIRVDGTPEPPDPQPAVILMPSPSLVSTRSRSLQESLPAESRIEQRNRKNKRKRGKDFSLDWDPMLLSIIVIQIIVFVYFVTMTELLLRLNSIADSSQNSAWSFGQILALIVVVPSLISVYRAFREKGMSNLHRRKRKWTTRKNRASVV